MKQLTGYLILPFAAVYSKQIKLAKDLTQIDFSRLDGVKRDCREILSSSKFIDEKRCENICYAVQKRIDMLKNLL